MSGIHADGDVIDTAATVSDVVREAAGRLGYASGSSKWHPKRVLHPSPAEFVELRLLPASAGGCWVVSDG